MKFGAFDRYILLLPQDSLFRWFEKHLHLFPPSSWKRRVTNLMESNKWTLLDFLPAPQRQTNATSRSFNESIPHFATILASTFIRYRAGRESIAAMAIMPREIAHAYKFVATFRCYTDNDRHEISPIMMHVSERRLISEIYLKYSKFARTKMNEMGKNLASPVDRADFTNIRDSLTSFFVVKHYRRIRGVCWRNMAWVDTPIGVRLYHIFHICLCLKV